jgi:hypothetical protein
MECELLGELRGDLALESCGQLFSLTDVCINRFPVVMIIGQCGIDVRKGQLGVMGDYFIRRVAKALMPDDDILDPDTVPGNARLAAANPGVMSMCWAITDSISIPQFPL